MTEVQFINGLMFKPPVKKDGSPLPHFIKAKGWIKRTELIATLENMEGDSINFDVKESKGGKWYASIDTWEPNRDQVNAEGMGNARQAAGTPRDGIIPGKDHAQPATDFGNFDDDIPF